MKKATIIFNPVAGKGKTRELTKYLENKLLQEFDSVEIQATEKPRDAILFATEACINGVHSIFALGGDGTVNEVVQGIMDASCEKKPILGAIPGGTFNGVSRIMEFSQN